MMSIRTKKKKKKMEAEKGKKGKNERKEMKRWVCTSCLAFLCTMRFTMRKQHPAHVAIHLQ